MELSNIYSTRRMGAHKVNHHFRGPRNHGFYQVLDEFSIPEAYLFSAMIQYFTENELRYEPLLMFRSIRSAIGDVHISQSLYKEVRDNKDTGTHVIREITKEFRSCPCQLSHHMTHDS